MWDFAILSFSILLDIKLTQTYHGIVPFLYIVFKYQKTDFLLFSGSIGRKHSVRDRLQISLIIPERIKRNDNLLFPPEIIKKP